jgi:hypothetical protein
MFNTTRARRTHARTHVCAPSAVNTTRAHSCTTALATALEQLSLETDTTPKQTE